jgi:hypothetical protein
MRLGELLVNEGKITEAELEETLKGQAIFGGRFGTNLIEMGLLDENELATFLSRKSGVPHASSEQLMNISPQVIRILPLESVKKYRAVPIALNNRKLSLAMTDPSDYAAIDEISFVTGYTVVPHITPELRLVCALEKYYNVKRDLRYIPVAGGGRNRAWGNKAQAITGLQLVPPPKPPVSEPDDFDVFELPPLDEFDCFGDMNEAPIHTPAQAPQPASAPITSPPLRPLASATLAAVAPRREPEKDFSLDGVLRGLAEATDRNNIAELIVGYTARQFNRSALFLVKGDQASGWLAQIGSQPLAGFNNLEIALNEPSVLKVVTESKTFCLGALPISPCNSRITAALGGGSSPNQLLAPLLMMGRVVAILYVDGGTRHLDSSVPGLQKLLSKGSMAFEILILKSKITMT